VIKAALFLRKLTELIPPSNETGHTLTIENDKFTLTIWYADVWHSFQLDDEDFNTPVNELAHSICQTLADILETK